MFVAGLHLCSKKYVFSFYRDERVCEGKMKRGIGWNLSNLGVIRYLKELVPSGVRVSRNWYKTVSQLYQNYYVQTQICANSAQKLHVQSLIHVTIGIFPIKNI